MRKFKLLKDLPDVKAGAISGPITYDSELVVFYDSVGYCRYQKFNGHFCKDLPEWFEEIKEEPKKTVRRWLWVYESEKIYSNIKKSKWMLCTEFLTNDEAYDKFQVINFVNFKKLIIKKEEIYLDCEE